MKEEDILGKLQYQNRGKYQQLTSKRQMVSDRISERTGVILDYDPSGGNYTVQDGTGRVVSARAICNSSALCLGAAVSLVTPAAAAMPIIDATPL